jgi:hypothetical protein
MSAPCVDEKTRQQRRPQGVLSLAWPALALATVCLLPFLNKPFLIDDPHFLAMARQILKHPLHPMDFELCWNLGTPCAKAYVFTPGNTLMGYVLIPTILAGSLEWVAHLTQLLLVWVILCETAVFLVRLGFNVAETTIGTLLMVAIPPLLPMASTAMPDVLAACLAIVGMERLAAWHSDRRWSQAILAGAALGMAGIARAHLALLVPLAAFFLFKSVRPPEMLGRFRQGPRIWIPVLIGASVLAAMLLATREHSLVLDPPAVFSGFRNIPRNLRSYLLYFCFPLPLALYWGTARWIHGRWRLAIAIVMAAAVGGKFHDWRMFLAAFGLCVIADLLWDAWWNADHPGVFLILWILVPLPIVYYGHLPIKYLLPSMPAVILLCLRLGRLIPFQLSRAIAFTVIACGTVYSLLLLRSDLELANNGKTALEHLVQPHVAAGEKVWYGNEFSAYWYAARAGAELITNERRPQPGDLLAVGLFEGGEWTLHSFPHRTLLETIPVKYSFGRTMGTRIGLYTNLAGRTWLWGFETNDSDRYELWRID